MIFENTKVGEFLLCKNGKVAEFCKAYMGQYDSFDCIVDNEMRIYKQDGTINSDNPSLQGYSLLRKITKEDDPEYFL